MSPNTKQYRNCLKMLLVAVFLVGCEPEYNKKYIVSKSDDNNWTTSGVIECDSVTMVNRNKATLWVDGQKLNLEGRLIKIFSNSDYVNPK